jgi:hypothetical protein
MKTAEILRNIINLLDVEEQPVQQQPIVINVNNGDKTPETPAEPAPKAELSLADRLGIINAKDTEEDPVDDDALGIMVPPLQQKIELIKKSEGVKSVYDEAPEEDELAILKRQAGIKTAVIADEDEPLEG